MDSKILLGRILQRFEDLGKAGGQRFNKFIFVRETASSVVVLRQNGARTVIPHKRLVTAIDYYKRKPEAYSLGPGELRKAGLTHITSPVYALLHLLADNRYL